MPTFTDDALKIRKARPFRRVDARDADECAVHRRICALADLGGGPELARIASHLGEHRPEFARIRALSNPARKLGIETDAGVPAMVGGRILAALPSLASSEAFDHCLLVLRESLALSCDAGGFTTARLDRRLKRLEDKDRRSANRLNTAQISSGAADCVVDLPYRQGALASRTGLVRRNPYSVEDPASAQWALGQSNEMKARHLVDAVDLITAPAKARTFIHPAKRPSLTAYASGIAASNGVANILKRTRRDNPYLTPGGLRIHLEEAGHSFGGDLLTILGQRLALEAVMSGRPLTLDEEDSLAGLTEPMKQLLMTAAVLHEEDGSQGGKTRWLGRANGRSRGWGAATVSRMRSKGLGFLIEASANGHFHLTRAGWTVVRRLESPIPEPAEEPIYRARHPGH